MAEARQPAHDHELLRLSALGVVFLFYRAWIEIVGIASGSGSLISGFGISPKWLIALAGIAVGFGTAATISTWALLRPRTLLPRFERFAAGYLARLGRWRYAIAMAIVCAPAIALLGDWGKHLTTPWFRISLLAMAGIAAGGVISDRPRQAVGRIGLMMLLAAAVFVVGKRMVLVTDYPFKMYWSEGNRLWDYSLYFARDRYQFAEPFDFPSYLTPGRHGLWGLPFLIPGAGIVLLRFWDAILWIVPALALGWALARRLDDQAPRSARIAVALWTLLFLTQIGVFAPLTLSLVLVVLTVDGRRPVRSASMAAVASLYAGLSRWTWFATPAVVAALWMLLESGERRSRIANAVGVGLAGLAGGLLSQAVMSIAFPSEEAIFSTALSQPLLWNRLWPNPTNPQGIVLGAVIAAGPLLGLLILGARRLRERWGWLENLGLVGALAGFLVVGLVASVKIGGGSNLHNLDMFMIGLVAMLGIVGSRLARSGALAAEALPITAQALIVLAIAIPSFDALRSGGPLQLPEDAQVDAALRQIRQGMVDALADGEVLFVDQRQLLTFGQISDVPLIVDYELKDMMNQAMSANQSYFDRFWADLADHRFELILSDPLAGFQQGTEYEFGEENDAWLRFVSGPLREAYQVSHNLQEVGIRLLTPQVAAR